MPSSLPKAQPSDLVRSSASVGPAFEVVGPRSDQIGPGQEKVGLRQDRSGLSWAVTMKDAIVRHYGSVKATAYALTEPGKAPLDPSLMMREFKEGDFGRFDAQADESAKASVAAGLAEVFAELMTPIARLHRDLDAIQERINSVRQGLLYFDDRRSA